MFLFLVSCICIVRATENQRFYFQDCYDGQSTTKVKVLKMGVMVDKLLYDDVGSNAELAKQGVYELLGAINEIFTDQFRIRIHVDTILVVGHDHVQNEASWMRQQKGDCLSSMNWRLGMFETWVKKAPLKGMWHLFSACRASAGVAGRTSTICDQSEGLNAGITLVSSFRETVKVFAHEVGHIMGAGHAFTLKNAEDKVMFTTKSQAGIMGYDATSEWNGIVQFHPGHNKTMCPHINETMHLEQSRRSHCWADEDGEDEHTRTFPSCACDRKLLGNKECNANCNNESCGFDLGDCKCASECFSWLRRNRRCDLECMNEDCGYDNNECHERGVCSPVYGWGYRGPYLVNGKRKAFSWTTCATLCKRRHDCAFWQWFGNPQNMCFLKSSIGRKERFAGPCAFDRKCTPAATTTASMTATTTTKATITATTNSRMKATTATISSCSKLHDSTKCVTGDGNRDEDCCAYNNEKPECADGYVYSRGLLGCRAGLNEHDRRTFTAQALYGVCCSRPAWRRSSLRGM